MDEATVGAGVQERPVARAWWLRFPPSVDEAVLEHGRAVGWLAAAAASSAVAALLIHEKVLGCAHRTVGTCAAPVSWIDGVFHVAGWVASVAAVGLLLVVYARVRHLMRRWRAELPFTPRRRLLELAVEEGTLARKDYDRLTEAFGETISGHTFSERLQIRADVLTAFGWLVSSAAALSVVLVALSLATAGSEALLPLTLLTMLLAAAGAFMLWAGRRVAVTAFDAGKWERHAARVLLDRALKRLSVDPPR